MMDHKNSRLRRAGKAVLLTLPILLLMGMIHPGQRLPQDAMEQIQIGVTYVFTVSIFFLIAYTGRTHKYAPRSS